MSYIFLSEPQQRVLDYLAKVPAATRIEIAKATGLPERQVKYILRYLYQRHEVAMYMAVVYTLPRGPGYE